MKKSNKIYNLIFATLIIFILGSCRPAFVAHSDIDRTVDFGQFATFTLAELAPEREDGIMDNRILQKRLMQYVAE